MKKSLFASCSLLLAAALASSAAQASVVNLTGYTYNPVESVTAVIQAIPAPYGPTAVNAGQFDGTLDGSPFVTFCADLYQTFSFGTTYTDYTIQPLTLIQTLDLGRLFTSHYAQVVDSSTAAAFQVAIWEILYEANPAYDVSSGNFLAFGASTPLAQNWLHNLGTFADITYTVQRLGNREQQDFLTWINVTPQLTVPEPSSLALFGIAAVGGLTASRKRKTA